MAPMLQRFEGCVLVGWRENHRTFTGAPPIFHRKVQTNAWNNKIALERNVFLFLKAWLGKMPSEKMWAPSRNMAPTIPMESQGLDPLVQSHVVSCCSLQPIHWPYDRKWSFGGWFQTCFIVSHCSSINDGTQWLKFEMGWNHRWVLSNFSTEQVLHCWPVSTGFGPCIWPQLGDSLGATGHQHSHQPT